MNDCIHPVTELVKFRKRGYPYQKNFGPIWICLSCNGHVGCHRGTTKPLGTPADGPTRLARRQAHAAFDALWKGKPKTVRTQAYKKLSQHFGGRDMHIGSSNIDECREIILWATAQAFEQCDTITAP